MTAEETPKRRRSWIRWSAVIFLLAGSWYFLSAPWFKGRDVISIELNMMGAVPRTEITDRRIANSIFSVLRNARAASDHKCMSLGQIELFYPNGDSEVVGLLPGHNLKYYEFRLKGKCFRMPRDKFFHELERTGIDTSLLPKRDGEGVPPFTHP